VNELQEHTIKQVVGTIEANR